MKDTFYDIPVGATFKLHTGKLWTEDFSGWWGLGDLRNAINLPAINWMVGMIAIAEDWEFVKQRLYEYLEEQQEMELMYGGG